MRTANAGVDDEARAKSNPAAAAVVMAGLKEASEAEASVQLELNAGAVADNSNTIPIAVICFLDVLGEPRGGECFDVNDVDAHTAPTVAKLTKGTALNVYTSPQLVRTARRVSSRPHDVRACRRGLHSAPSALPSRVCSPIAFPDLLPHPHRHCAARSRLTLSKQSRIIAFACTGKSGKEEDDVHEVRENLPPPLCDRPVASLSTAPLFFDSLTAALSFSLPSHHLPPLDQLPCQPGLVGRSAGCFLPFVMAVTLIIAKLLRGSLKRNLRLSWSLRWVIHLV